jgi:hypothetical protein
MKTPRVIKSVCLSETRWLAYATAGVASAFGLSSTAEAEIHYSGNVLIRLTGNARATLPLSNGASLVFENVFRGSTFLQDCYFSIKGVISASAQEGSIHSWLWVLHLGENVSTGTFGSVAGNPDRGIVFRFWSDGYFQPYYGTRGFIGFRFNTGNGPQYGWVRIQTRRDPNNRAHELIKDYAWGDVGDVILAGQKHSLEQGNADSVSGSLGQLAFGAQGLDAWRTQRMPKSN